MQQIGVVAADLNQNKSHYLYMLYEGMRFRAPVGSCEINNNLVMMNLLPRMIIQAGVEAQRSGWDHP